MGSEISYHWERSYIPTGENFQDLDDVTGSLWFDDGIPVQQNYYYLARMTTEGASGSTPAVTAQVMGFKDVSVVGVDHLA